MKETVVKFLALIHILGIFFCVIVSIQRGDTFPLAVAVILSIMVFYLIRFVIPSARAFDESERLFDEFRRHVKLRSQIDEE